MPAHRLAHLLSFVVGFLSLSQEIVWVRMLSFGHSGRPHAFSLVLTAFLIGIAAGALVGRWRCRVSSDLRRDCGLALVFAGIIDILCLFVMPLALMPSGVAMLAATLLIALTAGAKGVVFPIVHQLGTTLDDPRTGQAISKVYIYNVLGATLGPVACGFFAMQWLSAAAIFALIGLTSIGIGLWLACGTALLAAANRPITLAAMAITAFAIGGHDDPLEAVARRPHANSVVDPMVQNRQGIVHLASAHDDGGAFTFGGNIYDGRVNVGLHNNSNRLDRVYLMGLLHPAPKRVLVTGLSTGAWTRVIAGFPGIERIDVVEINPAYVELIKQMPEIAPILNDPRVRIHIDDGRRWLRAHRDERYDLVFQNTTFHWRAYASMLLSRDYFEEIKNHLNPGGVATINTTGSLDVYYTAQAVFGHALRYENFVYVSNRPLSRRPDGEAFLRSARVGDAPAADERLFAQGAILHNLLNDPLQPVGAYIAAQKPAVAPRMISDMNLLPELRHGQPNPIPLLRAILPPTPAAQVTP